MERARTVFGALGAEPASAIGSRTTYSLPRSRRSPLSTETCPLKGATSRWTTASPSPSPPRERSSERSPCVNKSKIRGNRILLPRIFDLFTQGERSLDRSRGGLGLGLAVVQRLVTLHGGHVSVESGAGGDRGSEFVVRLPMAEAGSAPTPSGRVRARSTHVSCPDRGRPRGCAREPPCVAWLGGTHGPGGGRRN